VRLTLGGQEIPLFSMGLHANFNFHVFNYSVRLGTTQTGRLKSNSIVLLILSEPERIIIEIEYRP